jgi:predicted dehydrogenase
MPEEVGFTTMAATDAGTDAPEIGIGMLGYAFMGKAHTNGLKKIPYMMYPPAAVPKLVAIAGRTEDAVKTAAVRYGYEKYYTDWRAMIEDDDVDVFDNTGPNNAHAEPSIAAAEAGKHVFCEKPLARTGEEAKAMLDAVQKAGVQHMVAFNYRFVPAMVVARNLIASGKLGKVYHIRAQYLQEWIMDPEFEMVWRLRKEVAGSGALGDLGSHIIDIARFLLGSEPNRVMAMTKTFIEERPDGEGGTAKVDVDDAFISLMEFDNGALGTFEATRFAQGRKNALSLEVNAEKGSFTFDLERLNELNVLWADAEPKETRGFTNVLVSEAFHPYWKYWWPQGHIIGWEHTFAHELDHFLRAIVLDDAEVTPYGATFVDGYKNAVISDAIIESAQKGKMIDVKYDL